MKIHFVGSEGVSMKALARIMRSRGHVVTGSDAVLLGHDAAFVLGADLVVYTCAVGENNVEVVTARKSGIKTIERAEFLGMLSREYKNVLAISGSHGKTTVTGLCQEIFLPHNPTVHIGGSVVGHEESLLGSNNILITEACEYKRNFLHLSPEVSIILNVELDHTDYYKSQEDYESAFIALAKKTKKIIINGDDDACIRIKKASNSKCYTFGMSQNNMYRAQNIRQTKSGFCFDVLKMNEQFLSDVSLNLFGIHNVKNALASIVAADLFGLKKQTIKDGIANFRGVKRRLEHLFSDGGITVFSDYAHHPAELKTTIEAAREMGKKKVTIVFEPHTYSRTKTLHSEFVQALQLADRAILVPIFPAREDPLEGVTSQRLARDIIKQGKRAVAVNTFFEACDYIFQSKTSDEIVVFSGAGEIDKAAKICADMLKKLQ